MKIPCRTCNATGLRYLYTALDCRELLLFARYGSESKLAPASSGKRMVTKVRAGVSGKERAKLETCS